LKHMVSWLLLVFAAGPVLALAGEKTYVVDPAGTEVRIHVGKSGLLKFAGHEHLVLAPILEGEVVADPENVAGSRVSLAFEAKTLKVSEKGEPPEDVPKVEEKMRSADVLDVVNFPKIVFSSASIEGKQGTGGWDLKVTGELSLRGKKKGVTLPVRVELSGQTLKASGHFVLKHSDFGMSPVSAAGGSVKVKDEIEIDYSIVARSK
jgi:polyisoprenoid-binding protein YceI